MMTRNNEKFGLFGFVLVLGVLALVGGGVGEVEAAEKESKCAVCEDALAQIKMSISGEDLKSVDAIESAIEKYCKSVTLDTHKKLCYNIESIKRDISQPMKNGVPIETLCKRLSKKSAEVCAIRPPIKVEKGADYSKLRVGQLKQVLAARGVSCENCLEKEEFIKRCQETEHLEL